MSLLPTLFAFVAIAALFVGWLLWRSSQRPGVTGTPESGNALAAAIRSLGEKLIESDDREMRYSR